MDDEYIFPAPSFGTRFIEPCDGYLHYWVSHLPRKGELCNCEKYMFQLDGYAKRNYIRKLSEMSEQLKRSLPSDVIAAFSVFSEKELDLLEIFYLDETGELLGVGFIDPDTKKFTRFGDTTKYEALLVIEGHIRLEISN